MASVPVAASAVRRSKPKTASPKCFVWRLSPFTTTSPTWAPITDLNALRHGAPKAIKDTAHKLARIFYHLVKTRQPYDETVFAKLEARSQKRRFNKLQSIARQMGYTLVEAHA
jgi:hypothetical protein